MPLDHLLSFQLYSARNFPPLTEQFKTLAGLGFTNVEPYGGLYEDLDGLKAALDGAGLKTASGHFDIAMLEADPARAVAIARLLGMKTIIAPWLDESLRPTDAAGWQAIGARLGALARIFNAEGLAFGWHNHDFEFVALPDGNLPIEHLLADPAVGLELDIAWVARAGLDPRPWIDRYADRLLAVHVKDIAPEGENLDQDGWTNVGTGTVDWTAIWPHVAASRARVAVLEHDEPKDWVDFAAKSAKTVTALAAVSV